MAKLLTTHEEAFNPELARDVNAPSLVSHLNAGNSFGLEYPIIFGKRPDLNRWMEGDLDASADTDVLAEEKLFGIAAQLKEGGYWMAWNRHTGQVVAIANSGNEFVDDGFVNRFAKPEGYDKNTGIDYDAIS